MRDAVGPVGGSILYTQHFGLFHTGRTSENFAQSADGILDLINGGGVTLGSEGDESEEIITRSFKN